MSRHTLKMDLQATLIPYRMPLGIPHGGLHCMFTTQRRSLMIRLQDPGQQCTTSPAAAHSHREPRRMALAADGDVFNVPASSPLLQRNASHRTNGEDKDGNARAGLPRAVSCSAGGVDQDHVTFLPPAIARSLAISIMTTLVPLPVRKRDQVYFTAWRLPASGWGNVEIG